MASLKYCSLLCNTVAEAVTMLKQAFQNQEMKEKRKHANGMYRHFQTGNRSVEDAPPSGRPSYRTQENEDIIREPVLVDRRHTIDS